MRILKDRFGLLILLIILAIITVMSIKPGLYLLGWDNYSSYVNLKTNIFRTLFATWRAHRGFGVPSDSEVVDVFRQLFFLLLAPVAPEWFVDQLYVVGALIIGVLGMYVFVRRLTRQELAATIAGLFYLFNLNTLGTFYFPILSYISRFAFLPWVLLAAETLGYGTVSWPTYVLLGLLLLFSSGSYLTATVFVTTVMLLVIVVLTRGVSRRSVATFAFLIASQAFWLLPFGNYTKEKSAILPLAPTFMDVNEAQRNKPASFYSPFRQLTLTPSFFDTTYQTTGTTIKKPFHELSGRLNTPWYVGALLLFPLLLVAGCAYIITSYRRYRLLSWVPVTVFLFLFLSFKEYSPLGFVYHFLDQKIPYFSIVFRFGDTKFHPMVAFAGSIAAGVALSVLLEARRRILRPLAIGGMVGAAALTIFVYRGYLTGNLIGFFMYNRLPDAYRQAAALINTDPRRVRVLHLPFDSMAYWRSYSWGAIGSSFFHYLLDKPLMERTFEPASRENAAFNESVSKMLQNIQLVQDETGIADRAARFARVIREAGVGYIVLDETVSSEITSRGITYWGSLNYPDAKRMGEALLRYGLAEQVGRFPILTVLKVRDPAPAVSFEAETGVVRLFRRDGAVTVGRSDASLGFPMTISGSGFLQVSLPVSASDQHQLMVTVRSSSEGLVIRLYRRVLPTINEQQFLEQVGEYTVPISKLGLGDHLQLRDAFLANWQALPASSFGPLRLGIGETIVPLPAQIGPIEQYVADVLIQSKPETIELLGFGGSRRLTPDEFMLTDNPNCFGDATAGYSQAFDRSGDTLRIVSTNGSTCFRASVVGTGDHLEFRMKVRGKSRDKEEPPKPNMLRICMGPFGIDECYNTHQMLLVGQEKEVIVPAERAIGKVIHPSLSFALKNTTEQEQEMTIKEAAIDSFRRIARWALTLPAESQTHVPLLLNDQQGLAITIPKTMSPYAYYHTSDSGWTLTNKPCETPGGYRTFRMVREQLVARADNCFNQASQAVPFDSSNFLLWNVSYDLKSGQRPKFILKDEMTSYINEYVAPYTLVDPEPDVGDTRPKLFTIHQHSENEGVMAIGGMNVIPMPSSWKELTIGPAESGRKEYALPTRYAATQLLPSLWRVDLEGQSGSPMLLRFSEGYDRQWGVFDSIWTALWGKSLAPPVRCHGYANCFVLDGSRSRIYLLYTPERLSLLGWLVTLTALVWGWRYFITRLIHR